MTSSRTFVVRVSESPRRVVVDDVRDQQRALVCELGDVGARIEAWLDAPAAVPLAETCEGEREDPARGPP